jgi:hypothetical protein
MSAAEDLGKPLENLVVLDAFVIVKVDALDRPRREERTGVEYVVSQPGLHEPAVRTITTAEASCRRPLSAFESRNVPRLAGEQRL